MSIPTSSYNLQFLLHTRHNPTNTSHLYPTPRIPNETTALISHLYPLIHTYIPLISHTTYIPLISHLSHTYNPLISHLSPLTSHTSHLYPHTTQPHLHPTYIPHHLFHSLQFNFSSSSFNFLEFTLFLSISLPFSSGISEIENKLHFVLS